MRIKVKEPCILKLILLEMSSEEEIMSHNKRLIEDILKESQLWDSSIWQYRQNQGYSKWSWNFWHHLTLLVLCDEMHPRNFTNAHFYAKT